MDEAIGGIADGIDDSYVAMAQRVDTESANKIQVSFAINIEEPDALSARERKRVAVVDGKNMFLFERNDLMK
jgi:hypothetical protein